MYTSRMAAVAQGGRMSDFDPADVADYSDEYKEAINNFHQQTPGVTRHRGLGSMVTSAGGVASHAQMVGVLIV